jgi:hypothetical protein
MTDERLAEIMKIIYEPAYVDVNARDGVLELVTALTNAIGAEHEEREAERAKVARVRAMHLRMKSSLPGDERFGCERCDVFWPCDTIAALDGEEMK